MTKKDYKATAASLLAAYKQHGDLAGHTMAVKVMVAVFERDNPLFSRSKFLKACGV